MDNPENANQVAILRRLPSVDELLSADPVRAVAEAAGVRRATRLARLAIDSLRKDVRETVPGGGARIPTMSSKEAFLGEAVRRLLQGWDREDASRLRRVINATGVIVHTNLGRAPLSEKAIRAIVDEAAGYATLEYDVETGKRGSRGAHAEALVAELSGAESALVVNNCAAAAFLVLTVLAKGNEVIVSRGELVEIGGDFRVPDVLVQSGAVLREVGTTNRTKLRDYEQAINDRTGLILRVHPSNYRIIGFTESPSLKDLAELAHRSGLLLFEDAGSGALADLSAIGLGDEPSIPDSITDGADIVTFSGDKLLGGPQCGIIAGRKAIVEQIRKHPLYRAVRVDKLTYAALAATLDSYVRGKEREEVPVQRMLWISNDELADRASRFAELLERQTGGSSFKIVIVEGNSAVGGGAAPGVQPETSLIAITRDSLSASEIEQLLRLSDPPVITRISDGRVLIDLRTVAPGEEIEIGRAVSSIPENVAPRARETGDSVKSRA